MDDPTSPDHAQRLARHLTAVSVTLDDLDITAEEALRWVYRPPTTVRPESLMDISLADGRTVCIVKGRDGIPRTVWAHPVPDDTTVPEGPPSSEEVWARLGQLQVRAWFCPVRAHKGVEWRGDVAHCTSGTCELTSEDTRPWLRDMAEAIATAEAEVARLGGLLADVRAASSTEVAEAWRAADERAAEVQRLRSEVQRLRDELHAVKADPVAYRAADGTVTVDWPEGARSCLITREALDAIVDERAKLRGVARRALDRFRYTDQGNTASAWATADELTEDRREAGLT